MTARATVSVALATYNGERYLRAQLDSIARQTVLPDELVVSDDGSTDGTLALVHAFGVEAPFRVHVIAGARVGFAANFLRAAEACAGDLIAFADQDDVWLPTKLATTRDAMIAYDALAVLHMATLTDAMLNPIGLHRQGIVRSGVHEALKLDPYVAGWGNTLMIRRALLHLIPSRERPPKQPEKDMPLAHDTWTYTLATALGRVVHVAEPLLLYRQHGGNVTSDHRATRAQRLRGLVTVPLARHRARIAFFAQMRAVFERIGGSPDPLLAAAALRAAARYAELGDALAARLRVHEAPRMVDRFAGLVARRRLGQSHAGSLAKDFVLGVCRLGREA